MQSSVEQRWIIVDKTFIWMALNILTKNTDVETNFEKNMDVESNLAKNTDVVSNLAKNTDVVSNLAKNTDVESSSIKCWKGSTRAASQWG